MFLSRLLQSDGRATIGPLYEADEECVIKSVDAESAAIYLFNGAITNDERLFAKLVCESTINPCCKLEGLGKISKLLKGPTKNQNYESVNSYIMKRKNNNYT